MKGLKMGVYKHMVNVKFDDFTFDILNRFVKELKEKLRQTDPEEAEKVTRSDVIRRSVLFAYYVGLKGYTLEEAIKKIEEDGRKFI